MLVVAPDEPRAYESEINQPTATNELPKLSRLHVVQLLSAVSFFVETHDAIEVSSHQRRHALHQESKNLHPEHPPVPVLGARIDTEEEPGLPRLVRNDKNTCCSYL